MFTANNNQDNFKNKHRNVPQTLRLPPSHLGTSLRI